MVGACVISDEYSASFRWIIFRKSKSRLYCHKLGKGEKVIHYTAHTHTHTGYIPLWVVREIVPLFLISLRIESLLLPSSEILTYV